MSEKQKTDMEINDHTIEKTLTPNPYGATHTFRCVEDGCWIEAKGEHDVRSQIKRLAREHDCPSGTERCIRCGLDITPDAEICRKCKTDIRVGERI